MSTDGPVFSGSTERPTVPFSLGPLRDSTKTATCQCKWAASLLGEKKPARRRGRESRPFVSGAQPRAWSAASARLRERPPQQPPPQQPPPQRLRRRASSAATTVSHRRPRRLEPRCRAVRHSWRRSGRRAVRHQQERSSASASGRRRDGVLLRTRAAPSDRTSERVGQPVRGCSCPMQCAGLAGTAELLYERRRSRRSGLEEETQSQPRLAQLLTGRWRRRRACLEGRAGWVCRLGCVVLCAACWETHTVRGGGAPQQHEHSMSAAARCMSSTRAGVGRTRGPSADRALITSCGHLVHHLCVLKY